MMDDYGVESNDNRMANQASNPFLQDFADPGTTGGGENPFLNFGADQSYQSSAITVDSTNPFASFTAETTAPSAGFEDTTTDATTANIFSTESSNIFATTTDDESSANLFDAPISSQASDELFSQELQSAPPPSPAVPVTPPQAKNGRPAPSRPPPPRPQPPPVPPKNTKDLILSVTGAMDATSNHLLDRLQVCFVYYYSVLMESKSTLNRQF